MAYNSTQNYSENDSPMSYCHHPPPPFAPHDAPIVAEVFGTPDIGGMAVFYRLKLVSHLIGLLVAAHHREDALSHARMRLLTQLVIEKLQGNDAGLQPSEVSRYQGISRNTVSTLLNGLEAQGLIERHLHPDDRRQWLVRVTPEGETLVRARAPEVAAFISSLFDALTAEEQHSLMALLDKLHAGLAQRAEALASHRTASPAERP